MHTAQNSAPAGKQQQEKCPGQQGHHHVKMLRHSCVCAWQRERKQRHRKRGSTWTQAINNEQIDEFGFPHTRTSCSMWHHRWSSFIPAGFYLLAPIQFIPSFTLTKSFMPTLISVSFNSAPYLHLRPFSPDFTFGVVIKKKGGGGTKMQSCQRHTLHGLWRDTGFMQIQLSRQVIIESHLVCRFAAS